MLTVGVDTYITLEDANNYVNTHYKDDNELRVKWNDTKEDNKEVLLRQSTSALDRLKYGVGRKKNNQKFQFPRIFNTYGYGMYSIPYVSQFYDSGLIRDNGPYHDPDGMIAIAEATIVNALYMNLYTNDIQEKNRLNITGITSKKMGNISKTYSLSSNVNSELAQRNIFTREVFSILVDWCPSIYGTM